MSNLVKDITSFRGASGTAYAFESVNPESSWCRHGAVALFAAPDAFGWRIVKMVNISGRDHDTRPLWAFADAQRYGAMTIFLHVCSKTETRKDILSDLSRGLTPVCMTDFDLAVAA